MVAGFPSALYRMAKPLATSIASVNLFLLGIVAMLCSFLQPAKGLPQAVLDVCRLGCGDNALSFGIGFEVPIHHVVIQPLVVIRPGGEGPFAIDELHDTQTFEPAIDDMELDLKGLPTFANLVLCHYAVSFSLVYQVDSTIVNKAERFVNPSAKQLSTSFRAPEGATAKRGIQ